jgi:hypothetical protein
VGSILSGIPPEIITGGGFASLVFLCVWLILTGRLVPRATHLETRLDRDSWRKAAEDSEAARRVQAQQLDALLESAKATERVMTALHETLGRRGGGGR